MKKAKKKSRSAHAAQPKQQAWQLRLYIAGSSRPSLQALANLQLFCERYIESQYSLEVVDILDDPDSAIRDGIIATPALVCVCPKPCKTLIGCLSDFDTVARTLNVHIGPSTRPRWPQGDAFVQSLGSA